MVPLGFASWKLRPDWGLKGIWGALFVGYSVVTLIAGAMVYRSDWVALAAVARQRADSGEKEAAREEGEGEGEGDGGEDERDEDYRKKKGGKALFAGEEPLLMGEA